MRLLLLLLSSSLLLPLGACRRQEAIEKFSRPSGQETFDHSRLSDLLGRHVNADGDVAYAAWKDSAEDFRRLEDYLAAVRGATPSRMSPPEAEAFWINVYNALTIRGILEFYPLGSIKDKVSHFPGAYNIWDDYRIAVEGKDLSLNDIEHRILRKMGDPRIHFALVCAARGCPRLLREAYRGAALDAQLDENARHFFAQPKHFRLDREKNAVHLSSILDWFKGDFGATDRERLNFVARFLGPEERAYLEKHDPAIRFIDYDWSLNDQRSRT